MGHPSPNFKRRSFILAPTSVVAMSGHNNDGESNEAEFPTVLIVNSSFDMAREITGELLRRIPTANLLYAPTLELAKFMLKKRRISLLVSNAVLPDGSVLLLQKTLEEIESPPDVIVVGSLSAANKEILRRVGYKHVASKTLALANAESEESQPTIVRDPIRRLGEDLRNDLNNPLQAIVAMLFVARSSSESGSVATEAFDAMDRAAKGMADVVRGLEDKIRSAVVLPTIHRGARHSARSVDF